MDRNSPQSAGKERQPAVAGGELPAVRAFSDVAWLSWKNMADDIKDLNYFMSLSINNPETAAIISRAVREVMPDARSFPEWSGYKFDTKTPQGQAILGQYLVLYYETRTLTLFRNAQCSGLQLLPLATQSYAW
jgi:hypothetical protein